MTTGKMQLEEHKLASTLDDLIPNPNYALGIDMEKAIPKVTEAVLNEAKANPGGWVYHVDSKYLPGHHVPPEAIVGAWEVDSKGKLTEPFVAEKAVLQFPMD